MFFVDVFCRPAAGFDSSCEPPARFMAQTWVGSKLGLDGMHAIDEKDKLVLGRIQNLDSKYFLSLWLFWLRHSWHKNTIFSFFHFFTFFSFCCSFNSQDKRFQWTLKKGKNKMSWKVLFNYLLRWTYFVNKVSKSSNKMSPFYDYKYEVLVKYNKEADAKLLLPFFPKSN